MSVIVSEANRILAVPNTGAVINMFPGAQTMAHENNNFLLIPHGIRETILLKRIGFRVPSPILKYYDWKGGTPYAVQRDTCAMLTNNPRAYVLNDMGTGKTKSALWAWDYLHGNGCAGKLLVIAPLSTLNFTWARECFATLPHRKVAVLHGTKAKRLERLREDADIYIINHDGLSVIRDELAARTDIDTLVLDELAAYRNDNQRSKAMRKFAKRFAWVWGMSGAPMPNEPTDVWAQAMIITPHTVPARRGHARQMLMTQISQFKFVPKPEAVATAFNMLQPAVRYSLDDVLELPDTVSRTVDVPLSAEQDKIYKKVAAEFQVMVKDKQITAVNAGAAMNKLLQIASGWVYTANPEFVKLDATPRTDVMVDLINSAARKVLVFVPFRHAVDGLSKVLDNAQIEHAVVHGGVSNRDHIFNLFQNSEKYKVLLAHPACLAHGLTLTVADTIIWYSPTASLETYEQANARIRRIGQKHRQQILHLQGTPVERKIYALLRGKQKVQDQLLSMFEDATERSVK